PRSLSAWAPAATAASRSRASARSSSPYTVLVPRSEGCLVSMVKDRPSWAWRRRGSASSGMTRAMGPSTASWGVAAAGGAPPGLKPADGLPEEPVELGGADLVRDVGHMEVDIGGRLH